MDREQVLSRIYLKAVLPLIEEVVRHDTVASELVKDWNCSLKMHIGGGTGTTLKFEGGRCEAVLDDDAPASIALYAGSAKRLNRMFAGEKVVPLPWKGFWHPGVLGGFSKLTGRLDYYMQPSGDVVNNPEHFNFVVKLMAYAALFGAKEIAENDEKMKKEIIPSMPDGVLQLVVNEGGPKAYFIKRGDKFTAGKGDAPEPPDAFMELKNPKLAYDLFNGSVDAMAAMGACELRIRGLVPFVDSLNALLGELGKYLA